MIAACTSPMTRAEEPCWRMARMIVKSTPLKAKFTSGPRIISPRRIGTCQANRSPSAASRQSGLRPAGFSGRNRPRIRRTVPNEIP
jgi:hypothetical protein